MQFVHLQLEAYKLRFLNEVWILLNNFIPNEKSRQFSSYPNNMLSKSSKLSNEKWTSQSNNEHCLCR